MSTVYKIVLVLDIKIIICYYRRLCKTRNFVQYQSLSDFGTAASRMLSGFEDFEVAKMQRLSKRAVLHRLLKLCIDNMLLLVIKTCLGNLSMLKMLRKYASLHSI